jgi:hypothetical protein
MVHLPSLDLSLALGDRVRVNTQLEPSLASLPHLNEADIYNNTASNDTPLPCKTLVLEHLGVEVGDIHDREDHDEAGNNGPEEELVVVDGLEHREGASGTLIHVEEAAVEVLHLPCCDEQQESQRGEGRGTSAVNKVTSIISALVAAFYHRVVTLTRCSIVDKHESTQAEGS